MAENLFSSEDKKRITAAIQEAEKQTSGEIQVHIERHCSIDVMDRAAEVFETLKMQMTNERNAVLFYLAVDDHLFAVIGDSGINRVVPEKFWENIKDEMVTLFKQKAFTEGLIKGISKCGTELKAHFPYEQKGDINELPDEISFG
jgi:uncharacterized membrane protein